MNRRPLLQAIAGGALLSTAGCVGTTPFADGPPDPDAVFAEQHFDGTALVVEFRDDVTVERLVLQDALGETEYETVERPSNPVRVPVVFPDRMETYLSEPSLHVKAETDRGPASQDVPSVVHASVRNVEILPDGRARLEIVNNGYASLLVRFVGIYGDVPNPTVDPQSDSFDRSSFDRGPGVVGVGSNRPLSTSRSDLVLSPDERGAFETLYAPFAFPEGAGVNACEGGKRTGHVVVVHAGGGSAAYYFRYHLHGEPTAIDGRSAAVCSDPVTVESP